MKKLYIYSCLLLLTSARVFSQESTPTWEFIGLDQATWSSPQTLTKGNSEVTVTFVRYGFGEANDIWVDNESYSSIEYIDLYDDTNIAPTAANSMPLSSYIEIAIPEGKDHIKKVEVIGYAITGSNDDTVLTEAYSTTTNVVTGIGGNATRDPYWLSLDGAAWGEILLLSKAYSGGNQYNACQTIGADIRGTEDDLKSIRYVRFNWSSRAFGALPHSGRGVPGRIFGLKIYTDLTGATGIETEESENDFDVLIKQNTLEFTKSVDVKVYNAIGHVVATGVNTTQVSTNNLPKGMYIIKASSRENQKSVITKKFMK